MRDGFDRARVTLERAADFLAAGLRAGAPVGPNPIAGPYRAKVIANGLRELDRFLNLLIDEARRVAGLPIFTHQRNTANKFTADDFQYRHSLADYERLRALGRSRECLFHCQGRVLRGDRADAERMTAGWPEIPGTVTPLRRFALGSEMSVSQQDLADVAVFYRRLGEEISAGVGMHQADI